ncbi:alpha-1,6-mannosyltransferase subunit [Aspergillus eucalypticola CBS 122712]|uniref:Alpha-1,6-mannosyltransferase subunit n=1 Tax=Aspergillus eucalypticola (strain CBS 122712 / IBT 29274) TaxID=1448314 RepID=A0A317V148_ASPEC|nr:alpha-1,6-mannosyltransferase subunit [Aspergillus eucalypticola CBS 122712]PWY65910.1 alpha-1,6-mannosyltransferase subunit [Aspergillus eucalypticola CBS 122712]
MRRRCLWVTQAIVLLGLLAAFYLTQSQSQALLQQDPVTINPLKVAIPQTVHQLFISTSGSRGSGFYPDRHSISWLQSGWKVEYWRETSCYELAQELDDTGSYAATFQALPAPILKSDFCRYLILFGRGGIYNDLDVHLLHPLPWPIMGAVKDGVDEPPAVIVGLEGDAATTGLPRSPQFVQWTMASVPGHPIFRDVLQSITDRTAHYISTQTAEADADIDVMSWTGPSAWTDAVLGYLQCDDEQIQQLRDLHEVVRVRDVIILPRRSFAVLQGEDQTSPDVLVKHYFSGSWKTCAREWLRWLWPRGC